MNTKRNSAERDHISGTYLMPLSARTDERGALVALDHEHKLPFELKRVFYIFDVPKGISRAGHAVSGESVLIAVSGSVNIVVDNGQAARALELCEPTKGLYVSPGILIHLQSFSTGAVLLVLSSKLYSEIKYSAKASFFPSSNPATDC